MAINCTLVAVGIEKTVVPNADSPRHSVAMPQKNPDNGFQSWFPEQVPRALGSSRRFPIDLRALPSVLRVLQFPLRSLTSQFSRSHI